MAFFKSGKQLQRSRLVAFFVLSFLFFFSGIVFADEEQVSPEKKLLWSINTTEVGHRGIVTVYIIVDHSRRGDIVVKSPTLPEGLSLRRSWNRNYSRLSNYKGHVKYQYAGEIRANRMGRFEIPPITVGINENGKYTEYATEPIHFASGVFKDGEFYIPPEPFWETEKNEIYVGETLLAELLVKNQPLVESVPFVEIRVSQTSSGVLSEYFSLREPVATDYSKRLFGTVPASAFLYTASEAGDLKIPSARVYQDGVYGTAGAITIKANPLPLEVESTGAVGDFSYETWMQATENIYMGDPVYFHVLVSGKGNLNYLQIPEPTVHGGSIAGVERIPAYRFRDGFFEGSLETVFMIYPEEEGIMQILPADFSFFSRKNGISKLRDKPVSFTVLPVIQNEQIEVEQAAIEDLFKLEPIEQVLSYGMTEYYKDPLNYLIFLPFVILIIIFSLIKKKKLILLFVGAVLFTSQAALPESEDELSEAYSLYESGKFLESQELFSQLAEQYPLNPGLYYNRALAAYRNDNIGISVYSIRKAISISTFNNHYRNLLDRIEEEQGLLYQVDKPFYFHPDAYFFVLVGVAAILVLFYILLLYKRSFLRTVGVISSLVGILICVIGMSYSLYKRGVNFGVVGESETVVYKIPSVEGAPWFELKPGTSLKIIDESGEFLLIETGYETKGWIQKERILGLE